MTCNENTAVTAYKPHPILSRIPPMRPEERLQLVDSIRRNKLLNRITLHGDLVVDGRERQDACIQLGITPEYVQMPAGMDVREYIVAANNVRRHYTVSERACIAVMMAADIEAEDADASRQQNLVEDAYIKAKREYAEWEASRSPLFEDEPETRTPPVPPPTIQTNGKTRDRIGKWVHVSGASVAKAQRIRKTDPTLFDRVFRGEVDIDQALRIMKSDPAHCRLPAREPASLVSGRIAGQWRMGRATVEMGTDDIDHREALITDLVALIEHQTECSNLVLEVVEVYTEGQMVSQALRPGRLNIAGHWEKRLP